MSDPFSLLDLTASEPRVASRPAASVYKMIGMLALWTPAIEALAKEWDITPAEARQAILFASVQSAWPPKTGQ